MGGSSNVEGSSNGKGPACNALVQRPMDLGVGWAHTH